MNPISEDGEVDSAAQRGAETAQRRYRARWIRIGAAEVAIVAAVTAAALLTRGTVQHHQAGTTGAPTSEAPSSAAALSSSSPVTHRRTEPVSSPASQGIGKPSATEALSPSATPVAPEAFKVSPGGGPPGTTVTVEGAGLSQVQDVLFGGVLAPPEAARSDSLIMVVAPKQGSEPGETVPISLQTENGMVATGFRFTYPGVSDSATATPDTANTAPATPVVTPP